MKKPETVVQVKNGIPVELWVPHTLKDLRCYGDIRIRAFPSKKCWSEIAWYFIGVLMNRTLQSSLETQNVLFSCWKIFQQFIFFNTRTETLYLRATMWYPLFISCSIEWFKFSWVVCTSSTCKHPLFFFFQQTLKDFVCLFVCLVVFNAVGLIADLCVGQCVKWFIFSW